MLKKMRTQVLFDKKKEKKEQKQQKKIKKKVEIPDKIFTLLSDDEDNDLKDLEEETNQYEPNIRKYNKTQSNGHTNDLFSTTFLN